jgi:hypothetical protein
MPSTCQCVQRINETGVNAIVNITHQEGDIAVHEEVFGMSNE